MFSSEPSVGRPLKWTLIASLLLAVVTGCQIIAGITDRSEAVHDAALSSKPCTGSASCNNGEICIFGTCSQTCRKDGDCPPGSRCLATDDGAACVTPTQATCTGSSCPSGSTCHEGQCRSDCAGATDCQPDQVCVAGACRGTDLKRDPGPALDSGTAGTGGAGTGGAPPGSGGRVPDASAGSGGVVGSGGAAGSGGASTGGAGGGGGAGGAGTGGVSSGGAGGAVGVANGENCTIGGDCSSTFCVNGICCALSCTTPSVCQDAAAATCPNGTACQYAAKNCADTDACTDDSCDPATGACKHAATNCDDREPCTDDTCSTTTGCKHTDNTASCTDNDPCTNDSCNGGVCVGTPKDCSSLDGQCTQGKCVAGSCQAQAANANAACTGGFTSCYATGKCASGACVGDTPACGTLSMSCATCTSGSGCFNGRNCTCQPNNISVNGVCEPLTNECDAAPCASIATCNDPSSTIGDVVCTCPSGYTGNGKGSGGCVDVNECLSANPCEAGGTCVNAPGRYTCNCNTGFKKITVSGAEQCVCDLSGTYGLMTTTNLALSSTSTTESASGVPVYSWALRYDTVQADGAMDVQTIPCGATLPTICDTALNFAHTQFRPSSIWGKKKVNDGVAAFSKSLVGVVPGASYAEGQTAALEGISLTDPMGAWPFCNVCVGVNAGATCVCSGTTRTVTNKATWIDADGDARLGDLSLAVPRGGQQIGSNYIIDGSVQNPAYEYPEPSECPRVATPHATWGYAEIPGIVNLTAFRAWRFYGASRVISGYSGSVSFANSKCSIAGNVTGPDSGRPRYDTRTQGCDTCSSGSPSSCTPGGACSINQTAFFDATIQAQQVQASTFTLKNVTPTIDLAPIVAMADGAAKETALNQACQQLRATNCPAGKTCQ